MLYMKPGKKPGVPLARGTVITHCYKDLNFMDFICKLVAKSVKVVDLFQNIICLLSLGFPCLCICILLCYVLIFSITYRIVEGVIY